MARFFLSILLLSSFCLHLKAQKPNVWIYTDMSDKNIPGNNHMGTINDPDDISAMAGYLLMCNMFETKGIVITSTHRKQHKNTPNQAEWAHLFLGEAYRKDVVYLNQNIGGYPADIRFIQSCIKESGDRYDPEKTYTSLDPYSTVKALYDTADKSKELINVLCWGSLTEPAILVNYCRQAGRQDILEKLRFIAHWTNSSWHQGSMDHPENVANCREDGEACAYLKLMALNGHIKYYECGAIGQHGIVSGSPKGNAYFDQFKTSHLGKIFAEGKFVHNSVDHSDAATYWTLLADWGVGLEDIASNGTNLPAKEKENEQQFEQWSKYIHDELLRRSLAASPKSDLLTKVAQHNQAIHIMDDWMRDPYITLGPDGMYYLTATQQNNGTKNLGVPVWKSSDLVNWQSLGFPYSLKDASNYLDVEQKQQEKNKNNPNAKGLRLWAPELHFIDGKWVIVHTSSAGLGNLAITENDQLSGPFQDMGARFNRHHDPTIFIDDDSSRYLVAKCTELIKLKDDLSGFDGEPILIGPSNRKMGHEGAFILKIEGKYVLFGTAWSTDQMRHGTYNLYYCTSDKLEGPYGPRKFAGRFLGHGTIFKDKLGRWWCTAFYNANQPPLNGKKAKEMDLSDTAYTINKQGLTLVPMEINMKDGEVVIYPKDNNYRYPGKEEAQQFK